MDRTLMVAFVLLATVGCQPTVTPPATPASPVVDTYHGVEVRDDYRWLEDWADPEVRAWSGAQNAYARHILEALPEVDLIRERVTDILSDTSTEYLSLTWNGELYLAKKKQPPLQQPILVAFESADDSDRERVVVDPNRIDPTGGTSIDWYAPSPDGRLVAVSLSEGGSELGDVHVFDIATGETTGETVPRVNAGTAGGDVAWSPDSSGFYYTRYPRPGERPDEDLSFYQEIWYHRLGSLTEDDRYELGRGWPKIAEFRIAVEPRTGTVLATYQFGDSGRFQLHLRSPDGNWSQLSDEQDQIVQAIFAPDGSLLLVSRSDSPRGKVLRIPPPVSSLERAEMIVAEGNDAIVTTFYGNTPIAVGDDRFYVTHQLGGPSTVRAFRFDGEPVLGPSIPPVSAVSKLTTGRDGVLLFARESYLDSPGWHRFDPTTGETIATALSSPPSVDFTDAEVVRELATSADSTQVPVNILRLRDMQLDGDRPTLVTGYGGFGSSRTPRYRPLWRIWLDAGGIVADANLRGGGEFGEQWHRDGKLTNKQNVFDDFAAAVQLMIDLGYTRPERLAIRGGSNGGLLMGALMTQHPELVRAVVSQVGIYDMLRVELSPNGTFNIPEYGTVEDPMQFRALHAYSPYHRVQDGTAYPAVLMTTGANDPRVDPMQSRKMTARLQAATSSNHSVLLRTSATTGHGLATPLADEIEEESHLLAFLFHELEVLDNP